MTRNLRAPSRAAALGAILLLAWLGLAAHPASATDLVITPDGRAMFTGHEFRCALGRSGVCQDKREGDGHTPCGAYFLREVWFRADKINEPIMTRLPARIITPDDAWCDDPQSRLYNMPVKLPFSGSYEKLWRDDDLYDLIVVVGYNDDPPVPGKGSAIFLHVAREGYTPTAGCIALQKKDLLAIVRKLDRRSRVIIQARP